MKSYLHFLLLHLPGSIRAVWCALLALGLNSAILPSARAADTFGITGSMNTGRYSHTATLLPNGKVLVAGGSTGRDSYLSSAELYDPASGSWAATGSLQAARERHTATLLPNGKVLVVGGLGYGWNPPREELYDPATGTWTLTGSLATPRYLHSATLLPNGKVLVAGGNGGGVGGNFSLTSAELYDPAIGTWAATGAMLDVHQFSTMTLLPNGKVLVAGGYSISNFAGAELYDPASGTWTRTGAVVTARYYHTATLLPNGKVLVAGGYNNFIDVDGELSRAELYDPATGEWTATGAMGTARMWHMATLLPNGKVLVAGGQSRFALHLIAELYDPATRVWAATGAMSTARHSYNATMTVLTNGNVLVTGGNVASDLASAEIYGSDVKYTVALSASPVAGGSTSGGGQVNSGSSVTMVATPNAGYSFVNWTEWGSPVSTTPRYTFTAYASRTLVANFTTVTYTISTSALPVAGGTTSGGGTRGSGSSVTLVATPNTGYRFVNWTEGGMEVITSASYNFTASANRTLVANFTPITYTITTGASPLAGGGTSGGGTFNAGSSVTAVAMPSTGYSFVNWTEGGTQVSTLASYNFTVSASRTLVANFTLITYTITTSASPLAGGGTSGGGTFNPDSSVTVEATPNTGYNFVNWTEGGTQVSTLASYNFTASANRTLAANFLSLSNNANLASLIPGAGTLSPAFASGTLSYTTTVPKSALYYTLTPTVAQADATVKVNGTTVASGTASAPIALSIGANVITIVVTAPDEVTTQAYTLTVTRANTAPIMTDLTGSAKPHLLFQNIDTGQVQAWFLNGTGASINFGSGSGILTTGYLYGGSMPGWQLAGVADVNGDGIPDLLFQNTGSGQIQAWMLDGSGASINFGTGSGIKSTGYLYGGSLVGWRLAGIADVNNDGIPDLVFQNTGTGQVQAWMLDGTGASINFGTGAGYKNTGYLYGGSLVGWQLAGIADVNNDSIPDLIFQNTGTGQLQSWLLDGTGASINFGTGSGIISTGYLYGGSLVGWRLAEVADLNGDGFADLVFQSTSTGQVYVWFLDGTGASINLGTGSGIKSTGYLYGGSLVGWQLR